MQRITSGRSRRRLGALALALTLLAGGAHAIDYTSFSGGDWSMSTNWSPVGVPGAADTVAINHGMTTSVPVQIATVTVNTGGSLTTGSNFATSGDITLSGTGTADFAAGTLTFNGAGPQTVTGSPSWARSPS